VNIEVAKVFACEKFNPGRDKVLVNVNVPFTPWLMKLYPIPLASHIFGPNLRQARIPFQNISFETVVTYFDNFAVENMTLENPIGTGW
jgi:hypothetical protein